MTFWSAVRYFHSVTPVRIYFRAAMIGIVLLEVELAIQGSRSDAALVSLLIVQMFAVSTGFRGHATRGHYDPLLTRLPRRTLALAHWTASATPGVLAWVAIGAVEGAGARSLRILALDPSAACALLLVSAVAWSVSAPLGPLTGGSLWLTASVAAVVNGGAMKLVGLFHAGVATPTPVRLAIAVALPPFMVGTPWSAAEIACLAGAAAISVLTTSAYLSRASFPLREEAS